MLDDMARAAGVYAGTLGAVPVTPYAMTISHPSQAARRMVELKEVDYKLVTVMPMAQKAHLRAARFRQGTVPAMKVDGKRVQGSRQIAPRSSSTTRRRPSSTGATATPTACATAWRRCRRCSTTPTR